MEKVYVENDWYDGPRKGVADLNGVPHRFIAHFNEEKGYEDTFSLFPISPDILNLEIEQWKIFTDWNDKYEAGKADTDSHPGHGEINIRWDEIDRMLQSSRNVLPESALIAKATFREIERVKRYEETGPSYEVVWHVISENA